MAGHSHAANIKHRKAAVDKKRAGVFSKHSRAIITAARMGGGDPGMNFKLAFAIEKARADNVPRDTIERAIKRGVGGGEGEQLSEVRYEGYGPGGVALLVDCITDNRNRTAPEMRQTFEKFGGRLADANAVSWMFETKALVAVAKAGVDEEKLTEAVMDIGGEDLTDVGETFEILGEPASLAQLKDGLAKKAYTVKSADLVMIAKNRVAPEADAARRILALLDALDEMDDVQTTWTNADISDELMKSIES